MAPGTHGALAALVIAASACRISTGLVARPATAQATASATTTTEAPGRAGWDTAKERIVFQAEMAALPGLTVEQARQRLEEYGHVGPVVVEELVDFHPGCALGTVCNTSDQGGTMIDDEIVLRVNRATLAIPAPPP